MHQTEHLSVSQAALELGCSRWTVVRRIKAGEIDATKLGDATAAWIIPRSEIERLAAERAA